jgi:alpha-D-ribose 1-methylphosphonate 5-phosphate C-P lyase
VLAAARIRMSSSRTIIIPPVPVHTPVPRDCLQARYVDGTWLDAGYGMVHCHVDRHNNITAAGTVDRLVRLPSKTNHTLILLPTPPPPPAPWCQQQRATAVIANGKDLRLYPTGWI